MICAPFDPGRCAEAAAVEEWSGPSDITATKVHHHYRQITVAHEGHIVRTDLRWLLDPFMPVWNAWLGRLDPGGYIKCHIDAGPYRERWQVPLAGRCTYTVDGATWHPRIGEPFQVHHHLRHAVTNDGDTPRVALVIDRDVLLPIPPGPLEVF